MRRYAVACYFSDRLIESIIVCLRYCTIIEYFELWRCGRWRFLYVRLAYFVCIWLSRCVCNATLTFSIESNSPNYSDKPGVLSQVSGVLQRLGWTSVLPLVARCYTSSTPGGGLLRPSSCQSILIYLGLMTSRIPTSIVRLSCAQIERGNYWSSWRPSLVSQLES